MGENILKLSTFAALAASLSIAACASRSENIAAAYVSPIQYTSYSCSQLREEASRVSTRAIQAAGVQDSKATNDAVATTVGAVIFWPALFFIKGDGASGAEVANLKGQMEAIEQASIQKRCGISFRRS